jgi:protein O-GlcNAc transferase
MSVERETYKACPLCGSADMAPALKADWTGHPLHAQVKGRLSPTISWTTCNACGHVFTDGYFKPEAFAVLMEGANAGQVFGEDFERQRLVSARMVEKILPFAGRGLWLDVGFGNGALLMTAQEYGFEVIGCDLRAAAVEAVRSLGIEAHCMEMTQLALPRKCSVLSMADVLEHLPFPKEGLRAAHGLLEPGGVLFASMPNTESMVWRLMNRARSNPYWGEIEHYHNFSRTRFYSLLEEMGFKPVRYGVSERYRACMEVIAQRV